MRLVTGVVFVGKPGSLSGPCIEPCAHQDCREDRLLVEKLCVRCKKPLGFGAFVSAPGEWCLSHLCCVWKV